MSESNGWTWVFVERGCTTTIYKLCSSSNLRGDKHLKCICNVYCFSCDPFQGDFVVLSIQCGRGLLQMLQRHMSGEEDQSSTDSPQRYVTEFDPFGEYHEPEKFDEQNFNDPNNLVEYFERRYRYNSHLADHFNFAWCCRACALIYSCGQRMAEHINSGKTPLAALDDEKIAFTKITKSHCHVVVLKAFKRFVDEAKTNKKIYLPLLRLLKLYALYWMEIEFADFIAAKVLKIEHRADLMSLIRSLMKVNICVLIFFSSFTCFPGIASRYRCYR